MSLRMATPFPLEPRSEHNLRFTENKIRLKFFHLSCFHKLKIIKTLRGKTSVYVN